MLVEMGIFDAYGAGFEFASSKFVAKNNDVEDYHVHPKWRGVPGRYTDDTQMTLALAELMLRAPPLVWTHYLVARAFVSAFKRDPREGYASRFYGLLTTMQTGWDFLKVIRPHSDKSGGAMRAPVLGLLPDIDQVIQAARFQASLTHCTQVGMDAAVVAAVMTHYCYYRIGPRDMLPEYLGEIFLCFRLDNPWHGLVGDPGNQHVHAAMTALIENDSMVDILRACVAFTGDVDTVAAIAAPAASFCDDIDQTLPAALVDGLENGPYGRDYLDGLDDRLLAKFPRPVDPPEEKTDGGEDPIMDLFGN
jgi:ADP-ribosyl-[dinitrogen reductase] hydrolase